MAARLHELRSSTGLTVRELAARMGVSAAKVSRIENAVTPPAKADITAWCEACDAPGNAPDLVAMSQRPTSSTWSGGAGTGPACSTPRNCSSASTSAPCATLSPDS